MVTACLQSPHLTMHFVGVSCKQEANPSCLGKEFPFHLVLELCLPGWMSQVEMITINTALEKLNIMLLTNI